VLFASLSFPAFICSICRMNEEDRAEAAEAAAATTDPFLDALHAYRDDIGSVHDVVAVVRAYRGKRRHLLWDRDRRLRISRRYIRRPYIYDCFDLLSEAKMAELIKALVDECPRFPTIRSKRDDGGFRMTFLYVALSLAQRKADSVVAGHSPHDGSTSVHVLKLLAAPKTSRLRGGDCDDNDYYRYLPLHQAVRIPCVSPEIVRHLVDLDPDVLSIPDDDKGIPLTRAVDEALWRQSPLSVTTILGTLVRRRPHTLLYQSRDMSTPLVVTAIERAPVVTTPEEDDPTTTSTASAAAVVDLLVEMVGLCPESIRQPLHGRDALRAATTRFPNHPRLIRAIVEASSPVALCLASSTNNGSGRWVLPVEAVHAQGNADAAAVRYLHEETTHLALASIEYVLSSRANHEAFRHPPVATFRRSVFTAVLSALAAAKRIPPRLKSDNDDDMDDSETAQPLPGTGYVLAQQLRGLERGPAVAWSVFTNSETASALAGHNHHHRRRTYDNATDPTAFLNAVLGEPVLKLYHLNRSDRSNPSSGHQLRLLASVSDCLDVIYLHFREVSAHLVAPSLSSSSSSKSSNVSASLEDDDPMEI
jgi:hypothetical protein